VWTVVGRVQDDRVVGNAQVIDKIEQSADVIIVVEHGVVVGRLPAPGAAQALGGGMRPKMHVGGVDPREPRRAGSVLTTDEVFGSVHEFVVAGLHAFLGQGTGVLDALPADPTPARLFRRIILLGRPTVKNPAWAKTLAEPWEVLGWRVVRKLRLLLRVEVVQVAVELVEAMHRRQELIEIPKVVLTELAGRMAEWLEQLRDGGLFSLQTDWRTWYAHLGQSGAKHALARQE
jgi:hypothetical protein